MIPDIKFGAWKGFAGSDLRRSELVITQSWSQETNYDRISKVEFPVAALFIVFKLPDALYIAMCVELCTTNYFH